MYIRVSLNRPGPRPKANLSDIIPGNSGFELKNSNLNLASKGLFYCIDLNFVEIVFQIFGNLNGVVIKIRCFLI